MAIQSVRGMPDILPEQAGAWRYLEQTAQRIFNAYGLTQIRTPIVEDTALFARSIGDVTDIVEKEMYTFDDRSGDSLTLRPELTAGVVRAAMARYPRCRRGHWADPWHTLDPLLPR